MPDENDLRDLLRSDHAPIYIDVRSAISRSARRRRPKQIAAGAISAFAIVGVVVIGAQGLPVVQQSALSTQDQGLAPAAAPGPNSASDTAAGGTSGIKRAPAEKLNLCEGSVAEPVPNPSGLLLGLMFPATAPVGTAPIVGTVRLVNTGQERVTGTTAPPAITLSQSGIVLWHSVPAGAAATAVAVDLAPGESVEFAASFVPVRCAVVDDEAPNFRDGLPAAPVGDYSLTAALDFALSSPTESLELVTGGPSAIALR
jgi:hypothetical protein